MFFYCICGWLTPPCPPRLPEIKLKTVYPFAVMLSNMLLQQAYESSSFVHNILCVLTTCMYMRAFTWVTRKHFPILTLHTIIPSTMSAVSAANKTLEPYELCSLFLKRCSRKLGSLQFKWQIHSLQSFTLGSVIGQWFCVCVCVCVFSVAPRNCWTDFNDIWWKVQPQPKE